MTALFDVPSLLVVIVFFVCTCTYLRSIRPTLFMRDSPNSFLRSCWYVQFYNFVADTLNVLNHHTHLCDSQESIEGG